VKHFANKDFWKRYYKLPQQVQKLADENFKLLKENPRHPSLHLKKVSRFWSVRVGIHYRSVGVDSPEGIIWFWIGTHEEYNNLF
jgi:mRNA-degrading endonuclease RelE of RelBE toxin-antitoxin system